MRVQDITSIIEDFAPLGLQESYDNAGLIVGSMQQQVDSALLCVDMTEKVLAEAVEIGADMIISHHPVIFHPLKRITDSTYIERVVAGAIRNDIALYASHTNLDSACGGMSDRAADMLGLRDKHLLEPNPTEPDSGLGIVGYLPQPMTAEEFFSRLKETFQVKSIRHSRICNELIGKVAVCTGAGAGLIESAIREEADIYLSSDFRYNNFLDAEGRIIIADIGHYESEYCAIDLIYDIIKKKLPNFALHKSRCSENPVYYSV